MTLVPLRSAVGLMLCSLFVVAPVWGQTGNQAQGTAYYTFSRPGQNTIEVLVIGGSKSGVYEVGENVDLGKLMALSGEGGGGGSTEVTVRLFRIENGERSKVLEEEMEDLTARSQYPSLEDGDVIRVETRQRNQFGWRDGLQIVTSISTLIFAFERLFRR